MDLLQYVCLSDRTGVNVQSYKREGALMVFAIRSDENTFHEAHVGLKRE